MPAICNSVPSQGVQENPRGFNYGPGWQDATHDQSTSQQHCEFCVNVVLISLSLRTMGLKLKLFPVFRIVQTISSTQTILER